MSVFDVLNKGVRSSALATDATYTRLSDSVETSLRVVFYNGFVEVGKVVTQRPHAGLNLSDLDEEPAKGDSLTIDSVDYTVKEIHRDGTGWATLVLQKV